MNLLSTHHLAARDAIIGAAKAIWGRDAWRWQAATAYAEGQLVVDRSVHAEWYLYRRLADGTSGATFSAVDWDELGKSGSGVTIDSHAGNFTPEDVGRISKRAPAMLFAVSGFETDPDLDVSRTRFSCWILAENRGAQNRWHMAASLAGQVESWLTFRSQNFCDPDIPGSPIMKRAENIRGSSVYGSKVDSKGFGLWVVEWWQDVDVSLLASADEVLAFQAPFGVGPNGPVPLADLERLFINIIPTSDVGADPDFPDNELETSAEINLP